MQTLNENSLPQDIPEMEISKVNEEVQDQEVLQHPLPQELIAKELFQRISTDEIEELGKSNCVHHRTPLTYYCTTCEEPICSECTLAGPHNTQMHRIVGIMDAYSQRITKISHIINSKLISKRDQLIERTKDIDTNIDKLKISQDKIERDIRTECGFILERLKTSEGEKLTLLTHEMQLVQNELEDMKEIKAKFAKFSADATEAKIAEFLACSTALNKNIEHILSKPVKQLIDVNPADLPHELKDIRGSLDHSKVLEEALKFKRELIWKTWQEKMEEENKAVQQIDRKATTEILEWNRMTNRFSEELKKFQMVCYYCSELMTPSSVNFECRLNAKRTLDPDFIGFTNETPKTNYNGNIRHFFGTPRDDLFVGKNIVTELRRAEERAEKGINPLKTSLIMQIEKAVDYISKLIKIKKIDLRKEFTELDIGATGRINSNQGTLNTIKFEYILAEQIGAPLKEVRKLIQILDHKQANFIVFEELLQWIQDPKKIEQYLAKIL